MPTVLFWAGVGGGTEHYRCKVPGAALARLGWDVTYVEDDDANFAVDVVVLQRVNHPDIPDLIRALQARGITVVYDIDDWYDGIPGYNPYSSEVGEHLATLHACLQLADLVTTTTPELAEGYARFGRTAVLPNFLDPDVWAGQKRSERDHVQIGWMGAASWRSADLDLLRPWLPDFLDQRPDVKLIVAGSPPEALADLGVEGFVTAPRRDGSYLRPYRDLPKMLAEFDVGLVPLTFNRFNQAKSWCKGMEYGAAGVPVVASPSREYRRFVQPGVNGQLARRDWPSRIDMILDDLDGYQRRAKRVADTYLIDRHIHAWVDVYTSMLGRREPCLTSSTS